MFSSNMITLFVIWISLITIKQHVHGCKVITVNNSGSNSTTCCTNGTCLCNSFRDALQSIENNTTVIITSEFVSLEDSVYVGVEYLNNVTITGNDVVVMCNNKGYIYLRSGNDIHIEGITWDRCGNPKYMYPGIKIENVYNVSISKCTFQHSKVCQTVYLIPGEEKDVFVYIVNSNFILNKVENASKCGNTYGSVVIQDYPYSHAKSANILISGSSFHSNGNPGQNRGIEMISFAALYCFLSSPLALKFVVENSVIYSNKITGMYLYNDASISQIVFNYVTVFNNSQGGVKMFKQGSYMTLDVVSCIFSENYNGPLVLDMNGKNNFVNFNEVVFVRNKGAYDSQGAALHIKANINTMINLFRCNFDNNTAINGKSIVYVVGQGMSQTLRSDVVVLVNSSRFMNNQMGSALRISQLKLIFQNLTLFQNNTAENGAAVYADITSIITITDDSLVQYVNNTAFRGGAIYSDLSNCFNNGILFSNFSDFSSFMFVNNTARISGNSLYFNIPNSCNVQRDYTKNDSVAYVPFKFKYVQAYNSIGSPIGTSPYKINLCSSHECTTTDKNCLITEKKMLGELVYFNATVCNYFNDIAEPVQFQIKCVNCTKYRVLNNEILISNSSSDKVAILAMNSYNGVVSDTNITLKISSVLPNNHKEFSANLSLILTTCYNGFVFNTVTQRCECYNSGSDDIVQCQDDRAEIKLGYWSGIIFENPITSLCPINYCNFNHRTETRSNYYNLPKEVDDQCSLHRTGMVCSICKSGYTLPYDSIKCINSEQCSPGMTILVIALTFLYWIVIVTVLFVLTYYCGTQVSSGYFNGVVYFYSIVDVVLVSNLYITDGMFYGVAILSSFAKLSPQFLGRLCFAKGLDAIDQQFIHYFHALCISFVLVGVIVAAKYFKKLAFYVNRCCISRVTYLFLLLSYTSITSSSLQLLRGVQYDDNDGVFVYLSPHIKYFTHQHGAYGTVALLCGLAVVIGLPFLLIVEPFLRKRASFRKFRPLLNQFQGSYKDKYQWFAAYYLLCRLTIMLIAYFGNRDHNDMVYYIQTACVIIVMNLFCFHPYKNQLLNMLDAAILLIMLLIVNLNNFTFAKSTTAGLIYTLLFIPLLLLLGIGFKKLLVSLRMKFQKSNGIGIQNPEIYERYY